MRTKEEYQEVLDNLRLGSTYQQFSIENYLRIQELIDLYPEYLELKKRDTPMKPIVSEYDKSLRCCVNCKSLICWDNNFCANCGVEIDWSGEV